MADRDLYKILEVSRDASPEEIKKSYRRLAKKLHPDRNPDDKAAEERFKDVSSAYAVVSDAEKRKLYDQFGEMGLREGFDPEAYQAATQGAGGFGGFDVGDIFGGSARGRGGGSQQGHVEFNFEDLFGGRGRGAYVRAPQKGADLRSEVAVDFREAVLGCQRELSLRSSEGERTLKVRIPAGVRNGGKIRLRGQGGLGVHGGPAGDLVLEVKVRKHPYFSIRGKQLHVRVPVTPLEAYAGAKVSVPTPEGAVQLSIPAGSQNGSKLRLRGKGIQQKGKPKGDLIAHLEIVVPEGHSPEVEEALKTVQDAFEKDPREGLEL
ncbi:MAG: J domain-containing protein [Deltaproteobacteria bacterium]|nr:J domain-containing protein [Deltaproteobacteria bacterium]MBW1875298.1 J domain-containing protein [Deltaproteobacteria bacterium]MBW2209565.1 J domain-containing protein [Deltaproteobacteria bacterium]MBW2214052.1 J domain-containing protein [Deltaproteobacteria bacterium]MBW2378902.1 J domain-containing protein [Deltaproteobacteria bacterium]